MDMSAKSMLGASSSPSIDEMDRISVCRNCCALVMLWMLLCSGMTAVWLPFWIGGQVCNDGGDDCVLDFSLSVLRYDRNEMGILFCGFGVLLCISGWK